MAFNSNTNPDGGDRPMSFADSDSFHRNELRNGHLNTPNSSMANHQFRFNVNAPAFIPRGSPAYGASQIGGSNSGWGRDPSHFGGSSDWMDGDAFTMSHNQVPGNVNRTSTAPRRNIYGTQYSQATLDSNFFGHQAQDPLRSQHPHYDSMSRNGFDDGAMFHSTSRNSLFDVASPMSMSYSSDPAVLLQQMESLGLSVRFDSTLNFSPSLTDRMNRSSYADTLREICVGLEQLCRPDIADNQSSEWDIAIKRCVLQLANQCSQRHASEDTVRELCSIVMSMVYESVHLKTGTSKRLAVLVGNILYHVPYFRDIFLYEISLFSLSQPLTVTKTADSLTFLSHVYLKLVHMHCTLPRIAMRIIEFITSLIELKPITDHHLLPIVSVLKLIGEHLDQYPDVRNRLNVVLTNVLGYAVGYHHTVSARTRTAVQGVIKIREDGWQSVKYRGYPYQRPGFDVDDDMLTEAEQRFVDGQIARNTPEVVESLDDDIQEDFERFLDASAQTALGVANSCLEEFSELSVKDTKPCGASTESGDVNAEKKSE
uniref:TAF6_C domain-containing protein n=1 Tax=Steinernema glaseri TaxID=37863 RepID=A0A1I7YRU0_9BILA